ncbi:MAG: class I SAM-dependent methyltransferase, partial [Chloroflexota bacterium]
CGLAERLPYRDAAFDVVCSSWVLEHLREPRQTFMDVARVLRDGGRFVFLTPNIRNPLLMVNRGLQWTQGRLVDRLYGRRDPDVFPAYYRANSRQRIDDLARRAGMVPVVFQFIGDPTYLAFNAQLYRLGCLMEQIMPLWMRVHLVGVYSVV